MCQKCYDRGYDDFPSFVGSAVHPEYYQKGFNDRQLECDQDAEELRPTDFCQKCFDRGVNDGEHDVWGPPTQQIRGHYSSYSQGYKSIEKKEKERQNEARNTHAQNKNDWYEKKETQQYKENKYKPPVNTSLEAIVIKLVIGIAVILGIIWLIAKAIWLAVAVILPLIVINVSTIALICAFVKKKWQKPLIVLSFLGAIYIFLDYNFGGLTKILPGNVEAFGDTIPFFFYLNFSAGLIAGYFIFRDLLNKRNHPSKDQTEFSKRNIIIMACLLVIGSTTFLLQNYYGENAFANNTSSTYDLPAPPAKRYDYTGTVISVQEEGNRGFVYLDIKKADGTVQTFLMNGAKVYKNNSEVDLKQLVKGITVGVTGGDISEKVDILSQ